MQQTMPTSSQEAMSTTLEQGIADIIAPEGDGYEANNIFVNGTTIANNYALWVIILGCFFIIMMVVSWIYSTKIDKFKNDFYRLSSLTTAFLYILDVTAYLLFMYYITLQTDFTTNLLLQSLLISAVIFIVIPVCITLYQLHLQLEKWDKQSVETGQWLSRNISFLCFMSILTLSPFTAIKLCRSHLFNLRQFSMPLTRSQSSKFQSQRLFTAILLQVCFDSLCCLLLTICIICFIYIIHRMFLKWSSRLSLFFILEDVLKNLIMIILYMLQLL